MGGKTSSARTPEKGAAPGDSPGGPHESPRCPPPGVKPPRGRSPRAPRGLGFVAVCEGHSLARGCVGTATGTDLSSPPQQLSPPSPLPRGTTSGSWGVPRSPQTHRVGQGQGQTRSRAEPGRTESGAGVWHVPGRGFRALLGGGRSRAPEQPHRVRFVWGSPPPLCPRPPRAAAGALCCSGLAGQLADPLAEVEGELEHGGRQALVDEVPGQATLQVRV